MNYFVTAIGTDSGKTLVSAIITEALQADYWKPVQAGYPRDTETVQSLVSNSKSHFHQERYLLNTPASPHASAKIDEVEIQLGNFDLPETNNDLVIEGAGGVLVPLNDKDVVIDLAHHFNTKVIVVCDLYLGSINHSLLTLDYLKQKNYNVKGIIFNGESNPESESIILKKSGLPCLLKIEKEEAIDKKTVTKYANLLNENWQ